MTTQDFIAKYNGKTKGYPTDSSYSGECLSIVKLWMKEKYGFNPPPSGSNSAYGYWSNFPNPLGDYYEKVAYTPDVIPKIEWIPIWNTKAGGGYGHIEIVSDNEATKSYFNSFGQNWNGKQAHFTKHNYTNVVGFLKPKESPMSNELTTCLEDRQKFWSERDSLLRELNAENVDGGIAVIRGLRSRSTDLGNQVGTLQAEVNNRKEQSGRIESQLLDTQAQLKLTDEQLQKALVDLKERSIEKGALAIEVEQLKVKIESLKQAQTEGGVTLTIGEVLRLILKQKITIKK